MRLDPKGFYRFPASPDLRIHLLSAWILCALLLLPVRAFSPLGSGTLNFGFFLALPLIPLAVREFLQVYRARSFASSSVVALVLLPIVVLYSSYQGRVFSLDGLVAQGGTIVKGIMILIIVGLARRRISIFLTTVAVALGLSLQFATQEVASDLNVLKYGYSVPIALVLLSLARGRSALTNAMALGMVVLISILADYRSLAGVALLSLAIGVFAPLLVRGKKSGPWFIPTAALIGYLVFLGSVELALQGYLGERNMYVTQEQLRTGGSLLGGGRQEWNATLSLMLHSPLGFGPGFLPNYADLVVAIEALADAGMNTNSVYVQEYLLGSVLELHSIIGDLWVVLGVGGLLISGAILAQFLESMRRWSASLSQGAFYSFIALLGIWDMIFSPIGTNLPFVMFALGLSLRFRSESESDASAIS